jgi:hypothetical protein
MAYNSAAGVERRHNLRFRFGGSLTWAAKPRVRGSPDPAIDVESIPARSPLLASYLLHGVTRFPQPRFRLLRISFNDELDDIPALTVANLHINSYEDWGTPHLCFVDRRKLVLFNR